jgi:hypothetical protein
MIRRASSAAVLGLSIVALAGCGSSQSDISGAVSKANSVLASQGVGISLSCPTKVDTTSQFDCTYTNKSNGKSVSVKFHLTGSNHDTLDVVNVTSAKAAVAQVTGSG